MRAPLRASNVFANPPVVAAPRSLEIGFLVTMQAEYGNVGREPDSAPIRAARNFPFETRERHLWRRDKSEPLDVVLMLAGTRCRARHLCRQTIPQGANQ
jgi:hypothetical protein